MTCDWGGLHNNRSSLQNELLVIDPCCPTPQISVFLQPGFWFNRPGASLYIDMGVWGWLCFAAMFDLFEAGIKGSAGNANLSPVGIFKAQSHIETELNYPGFKP